MPTITGTSGDDVWTVAYPTTFTLDGGAGTDTLYLGTSLRSSYTITKSGDGAVYVDSIGSASGALHATLYNIEVLVFNNKTDVLNLANYFGDTVPPVISSFSPAAQASNIAPNTNIVVQFNEEIVRGSGTIALAAANGTVVATYDAATSTNLTISGSTLTVDPSLDLGFNTTYKLVIPSGCIKDIAGNAFAGVANYNFTTAGGLVIAGSSNADAIIGSIANDTISAGNGNDTITGAGGNDSIDGGAGLDTAVFSGKLSNYTISHTGSTYTVHAKSGTDGTDTITNVESLKFADMSVNLTVQAQAAAAPQADVQRLIELYVAFFNRTPDEEGLSYWIGQKSAGQSSNAIAETFYNAGVQFSAQTGFSKAMSNADFVNVIYKNVLGRADGADTDGLSYWTGKLADGSATHGSLAASILDSAHTFKGDTTYGYVADLLDNKIAVARTVAIDWGLNYNASTDAITKGMAIAAAVTSTDITQALTLVGIAGLDMQLT